MLVLMCCVSFMCCVSYNSDLQLTILSFKRTPEDAEKLPVMNQTRIVRDYNIIFPSGNRWTLQQRPVKLILLCSDSLLY